ncbi:hypothetical protein HHS34_005690 [Acidithiobacillus montserratensis]|uniref:Uncharacterized protein n=1 Tax=Acidithiobacillus montserratensis TaxID=2729135 RepID=A0ACD5HL65_9PROT|nr:hypothetical protein [Acidithiobacillus montserratensis]MBU2748642.1 hypothetical protein [Acidithiobacillus montserratensis]
MLPYPICATGTVQSLMTVPLTLTIIFVLYICGYGWVLRRLADEVQPVRLQLAEFGESLLVQESLDRMQRLYVTWCLDHAFSPWPMAIASLITPFLAIKLAIVGLRKPSHYDDSRLAKLTWMFLLSTFAANPVFGIVYSLELLCLGLILLIRGGIPLVLRMAATTVRIESVSLSHAMRQHT